MRGFHLLWLAVLLSCAVCLPVAGTEFKLENGNIINGEVASADEDGVVFKLDVGGFSRREPWINFSQDSLKELAKDPKLLEHVEPFIELPPEVLAEQEKKRQIVVQPVVGRIERPQDPGFFSGLISPIGFLILAALLGASVYAGYEIALFRNQPVPLVCGVSAVFPVVGPILFLCMPSREVHGTEPAEHAEDTAASTVVANPLASSAAPGPSSGLSLAAGTKSSNEQALPQKFTRGDFTFNRRFFETKFPGFFRLVPSETEKDLVLAIKGTKHEYVAKRISRISSNEMHIQPISGSGETMVTFAEIASVTLRHKDAKS